MENENLVLEDETENVEDTTTEEMVPVEEPKGNFYTDVEMDKKLQDRYVRGKIRGEKEAKRKYGRIETMLKRGLEVDTLEEAEEKLAEFYSSKGIDVSTPEYDEDDLNVLARNDALSIINEGEYSVEEELRRLTDKGTSNMTKREKTMFKELMDSHNKTKAQKELNALGVDKEILESEEYKNFSKMLNPSMTEAEKYKMYEQYKPTAKKEKIGSMVSNPSSENEVKEFYTYDEASRFSKEDFDKNPDLFKAVQNSMLKW